MSRAATAAPPRPLTIQPTVAIIDDPTPTLWVATDLTAIVRPAGELGPHRRDLVQIEAGRARVYRHLDALWLGWLTTARQRAEVQHDQGRIDDALWQQLEARWSTIVAWSADHGLAAITCPPHYPAPTVHDRWAQGLVSWRRRHPEYCA